ncbi:MAG: hypothetical protein CMJ70_10110 [Planctomycetaceae bacterium]|nr:hypothetical protein [Planctomycetaceae bacterium]
MPIATRRGFYRRIGIRCQITGQPVLVAMSLRWQSGAAEVQPIAEQVGNLLHSHRRLQLMCRAIQS